MPELALSIALDNLANRIAFASDFSDGGEDIAYALYVLARNGRASIGDLRYYAEVKINDFGSALAQAQIGAALALYGDRNRAEAAFNTAVNWLGQAVDLPGGWREDYGTNLRDLAAILALAAENDVASVDAIGLADRLADLRDGRTYTSTQEDAWTLMAAAALIAEAGDAGLFDGEPVDGPLFARIADVQLAAGLTQIVNGGEAAVPAVVSVTGIPIEPPPAGGNGFTIERRYYTPDGTLVDPNTAAQNARFVVAITVTATEERAGQLLVVDPLPAGFEIENPNLSISGDVDRYPWLAAEAFIEHTEARTDRFVAAVYRWERAPLQFTVAYTVRAVSPGIFVHPGAVVEDMYRPERRANTAAGTVEVVGPTR